MSCKSNPAMKVNNTALRSTTNLLEKILYLRKMRRIKKNKLGDIFPGSPKSIKPQKRSKGDTQPYNKRYTDGSNSLKMNKERQTRLPSGQAKTKGSMSELKFSGQLSKRRVRILQSDWQVARIASPSFTASSEVGETEKAAYQPKSNRARKTTTMKTKGSILYNKCVSMFPKMWAGSSVV